MLAKENRLSKNNDFQTVFKKGKTLKGRFFLLKFLKKKNGPNRFGFVISNKVSKKAAERHLLKRRVVGVVESFMPEIEESFDFIILVLPGIGKITYNDVKKEMFGLFFSK